MEAAIDRLQQLFDGLCASDELISKALRIDEFAQAAKVEVRLRELLQAQWNQLARQAAKSAAHYIKAGKGDVTDSDLDKVQAIVDRTMAQFPGKVTDRFLKGIGDVYRLSHIAAARKAYGLTDAPLRFSVKKTMEIQKGTPEVVASFNLVDQQALDSMRRSQTFWIGKHYSQNVKNHVRETTREEILRQGRSRAAAGKTLQKTLGKSLGEVRVPKGFIGSSERYFEGLAATAATSARNISSLNAFYRAGFTTYAVVNPGDHRTCPTCGQLNGKEFTVNDGMALINKLSLASPAETKTLQPFITPSQAKAMTGGVSGTQSPTAGTKALARNGNLLPPFHYKCRCSVDIVSRDVPLPLPLGRTVSIPKTPLPPRPISPVLPTLPSRKVLEKEMKDLGKTAGLAERFNKPKDWSKLRVDTEKFMERNWGIKKNRFRNISQSKEMAPLRKKLGFRKKKGASGFHDWYGQIFLNPRYKEGMAESFLRAAGSKKFGNESLDVLIHELVHGANKLSAAAYEGAGAVVSEVVTETAARRIVLDMVNDRTASSFGYGYAYQRYIKQVRDIIADVAKLEAAQATAELEKASVLLNSKAQKKTVHTARAYVQAFTKQLPVHAKLTTSQRRTLMKRLMELEPDWF